MPTPLKILIAEDSSEDVELIMAQLCCDGFDPQWKRVESEQDFLAGLKNSPDIILSDYSMPRFSGLRAAELLKLSGLNIPFILISGTVGEHIAVEAMKYGATDYLLKDRIARLGPAVQRALREAREHAEHVRAELHVRQLNRIYTVLSAINQLIIRGDEPQATFETACRIAVEKGGFRMAWIGMLDATGQFLRPAASAGVLEGCLDALTIDLKDLAGSARPSGRAWLTGEHQIFNDLKNDPLAEPWRTVALACGYRSGAAFPLKVTGKTIGTFALYAAETNFFDAVELRLLDELARDIAFALENSQRAQERERALEQLRASEERFRELAETVQEVFWITDPAKRRMLYISPAYERIWGRSCQSLYEKPNSWLDAIHPEDRERVSQSAMAQQAAGDYDEEYRIIRPDLQIRWIRDTAFPVRNAAGQVERVVGVARDVTDRRQIAEQLRQSQKMEAFGQLAGGVAHDFNNILAVIQLQAGLLKAEQSLSLQQLDFASEIENACERAANLTRQLLLFSRKQTMQPRNLKLKDMVDNITRMLQRTLGEQIQLQFKFSEEPLVIHADPGMIDQILLNLMVNARDAMPKGGQIIIETSVAEFDEVSATQTAEARVGSYVCLSVTDTGSGIAPEVLPRIFEPFFTTKEVGKGTGLGLATVFGIVQQHKGWINVYSEVGRGSTFRIYLPRLIKASDTEFFWSSPASIRGGNETILLVEDDSSLRASVRTTLSRLGYRVLEASASRDALEVWKQHHDEIHLLLTDLVMPGGMTGRELAEQLLRQDPKLKVIYASGYSAEIACKDLLMEDGVNFLSKPFQAHKLAQIVRHRLDTNLS